MARPNTALLLRESVWSILLPLLVLSALFSGFLTAPEAAAFASAYAAVVGLFVHKTITTADVQAALSRAAVAAGTVLLLAGVGALFAALMEAAGFSNRLGDILYAFAGGRIGSLILLNLILLAAGCVLDMPAIISLLLPLLLPLAARCGLSTPHFGAMVAVNLAVGLVTPPQAYNIEAAARLAGVGMWPAARGAWPCLAAMLVALAAVAGIPEISLWLPRACGWPV